MRPGLGAVSRRMPGATSSTRPGSGAGPMPKSGTAGIPAAAGRADREVTTGSRRHGSGPGSRIGTLDVGLHGHGPHGLVEVAQRLAPARVGHGRLLIGGVPRQHDAHAVAV